MKQRFYKVWIKAKGHNCWYVDTKEVCNLDSATNRAKILLENEHLEVKIEEVTIQTETIYNSEEK
jgi:hypothetical protein